MSIVAINWAVSLRLLPSGKPASPTQRHILLLLANKASEAGEAWPSVKRLAEESGFTRRGVQLALKGLQDGGAIVSDAPRDQTRRTVVHWRLRLDWIGGEGERRSPQDADREGERPSRGGRTTFAGEANVLRGGREPRSPNPSENHQGTAIEPIPPPAAPAGARGRAPLVDGGAVVPAKAPSQKLQAGEPPGFAAWWRDFPRKKEGPAAALPAYRSALARGASEADLIGGLRAYEFNADPHYHPMPKTWLNQSRWTGEASTVPPRVAPAPSKPKSELTKVKEMVEKATGRSLGGIFAFGAHPDDAPDEPQFVRSRVVQ